MHVLLVTFRLAGLSPEAFAAHGEQVAPIFAAIPGLVAKYWLADPETSTYGGVYIWEGRAALDGYLKSDIFRGILANPHFAEVAARPFGTLAAATAVTGGRAGQSAVGDG